MVGDRIRLKEETRKALMSKEIVPRFVKIRERKYYPLEPHDSGFKGVVWKGRDDLGSSVAIKFAMSKDYENRSFHKEAILSNKLRGYPRFAQFIDAGIVKIKFPKCSRTFVCFVEEWIDGPTLDSYLQNSKSVSSEFLVCFVKMMCEALNNLQFNGLCHDDLHSRNIKIASPKVGSLTTDETEVKIIDTGSLKRVPTKKEIDDHRWFVYHVIAIRNAIYKRKKLSTTERHFLQSVIPLLNKMLDEDKTVALVDPSKITEQFESTWNECCHPTDEREPKLDDPFHYISAETISSDKLLVDLFAESCPWKSGVLSPDPIVLTGPRGCGKSTIFRRLSLKGMLVKGVEEIKDSNIAGFYIACSTGLRNYVNWIRSQNLVRRFRGEIRHLFNLLITKEVVSTLNIIATRDDKESLFGFTCSEEKRLYRFVVEKLRVPKSDSKRLQGVSPMAHAFELIEAEIEKCHDVMVRGLSIQQKTQPAYILDLTNFLNKNIPYFRQRKIVFFIDDLSTRQIPKEVQTVLNDVILERAKNHIFKISSDKYGWFGLDSLASVGEKTREFREIDCGKFYLVDADSAIKKRFTTELLAKRLELSGYKGTPEEIIGHSKYKEGSLGKAIRIRASKGKRVNDVYYGLETITALCCGDISVLLEIYRRIFKKGKVTIDTHQTVPAHLQHKVIEDVSRELCTYIKSYHPYGDDMYSIVTHFGTLSRRILHEGEPHRQKKNLIYPQTTRIEVDEDPTQPHMKLTDRQRRIMKELIKRAIFIELDPGRARHRLKPSLRWQLRPVLCPTFLTTPSKNIAIKWKPEEFRFFLTDPDEKCNVEFSKWRTKTIRRVSESEKELSAYWNMTKQGS